MTFAPRLFAAGALSTCCGVSCAVSVLAQTPQGTYTTNVLGGSAWTTFTGLMSATHAITRTTDFSNLAQLLSYTAVWVDQELDNFLAATEISSLRSYISAGHKAVLIGENNSWPNWDSSVMSVVGGGYTADCDSSIGTPLLANALTAGVSSAQSICGSRLLSSGGAQMLFNNNMAALYQIGAGQALVIMDSNWNDNTYLPSVGNLAFAQNVVNWLAVPVPEPKSYLLFLAGLALLPRIFRHSKGSSR